MVKVIKTVKTDKHHITYLKGFKTNHPKLNWEIAVKYELDGYGDPEFLVKQPQWDGGYMVYASNDPAFTDEHMKNKKVDYEAFENAETLKFSKD